MSSRTCEARVGIWRAVDVAGSEELNPALALAYEGAARLAHSLSSIAPHSQQKLLATFAERRGILARYSAFHRDPAAPLLWMHAPSVGEGLQARPVLQLARAERPGLQLAYTY